MATALQELNGGIASVAQAASRSLVQVRSGRRGAGAGTIWHADGLILTNAHVVGRGDHEVELPDGTRLPARVLAYDAARDLAALLVAASGLPTIPLGDSRSLQPGQFVMALGHPWGRRGAATAGVVIGIGDGLVETPFRGRDLIAVALPLRPGNSGGPLLDVAGRLVGINAMVTGPQVAFAVPVHVAVAFLKESLGSREGEAALAAG
ncbi:MAG: trypsin-like peptidase domain-containing protein [Chloroflexi bacterium]|nr:trypsin-like peptidase domain-containing protein [Chloroflexota bacterium]